MAYSKSLEPRSVIDRHFSVCQAGEVGFSLDMPYEELVRTLLPVQCVRSKPATDKDEVLFKVAIVPIEAGEKDGDQSMPLQHTIALPGFALVVSMNHTLGDGHTYYKLYSMLSADSEIEELNPVRVSDFEAAKTDMLAQKKKNRMEQMPLLENVLCEKNSPTHMFFNPCRFSLPASGLLTLIKDKRFEQNYKFS